ncbi:MAG TPA: hypothetical protein VK469_09780 [Candidatus Kapabacteria bacterium]|nr:hypothetical protein [Candidatus Kapabacteria bacterium]
MRVVFRYVCNACFYPQNVQVQSKELEFEEKGTVDYATNQKAFPYVGANHPKKPQKGGF